MIFIENLDVRKAARVAGVTLWRIAAEVGVSEPTLQRWMRFPLPGDKKERILAAIARLEEK